MADIAKKAETKFKESELEAVSRLSQLDTEVKRLGVQKQELSAKVPPLQSDASQIEVTLANLKEKLSILAIDRLLKDKAATNAQNAMQSLKANEDEDDDVEAIATVSSQDDEAKKAVEENEDEKEKLSREVVTQEDALKIKDEQLKTANAEEKSIKSQFKTQESGNKVATKEVKAMLQKQKQALTTDHEKALSSRMVALKAKEKVAKSERASAKVAIAAAEEEMKGVETAEDRRALEKKTATARGDLFKADSANGEVTTTLIENTKHLTKTKEKLHKVISTVAKAKKAEERQDIDNKLNQLESETSNSPL